MPAERFSQPVCDADGNELDARFLVENWEGQRSVVFESSGGGKHPRNREYNEGLRLILERLVGLQARLSRVLVDSNETQHLSDEQRTIAIPDYETPLHLTTDIDCHRLRQKIGAGAAKTARGPNAKSGKGGNIQKRIRLVLGFTKRVTPSLDELASVLRNGVQFDRDDMPARRTAAGDAPARQPRTVSTGQGREQDPKIREAVEEHAMLRAVAHYEAEGWQVERCEHENRGYDIECSKGRTRLYAEVKGTRSDGHSVIVTAREIEHAHNHAAHSELFIVHNIRVVRGQDGSVTAQGGEVRVFQAWDPRAVGELEPKVYKYTLPRKH